MNLTFSDIKKMEYPDGISFENVLVDLLYKKLIDVNMVLTSYTNAIDKENHLNSMKFEEACVNLSQILSGNFNKKEDKENMLKRAIHTFNLTDFLPKHIYDGQYNYTEEDEKTFDELCKCQYGTDLKQ